MVVVCVKGFESMDYIITLLLNFPPNSKHYLNQNTYHVRTIRNIKWTVECTATDGEPQSEFYSLPTGFYIQTTTMYVDRHVSSKCRSSEQRWKVIYTATVNDDSKQAMSVKMHDIQMILPFILCPGTIGSVLLPSSVFSPCQLLYYFHQNKALTAYRQEATELALKQQQQAKECIFNQ